MNMKELLVTVIGVAVGFILAQIIVKKVLKMDSWESDETVA
jgi:hypothetical protein